MTDTISTFTTGSNQTLGISPELLAILVCPADHAALTIDGSDLVCTKCGAHYPVEDGIPNLVIE